MATIITGITHVAQWRLECCKARPPLDGSPAHGGGGPTIVIIVIMLFLVVTYTYSDILVVVVFIAIDVFCMFINMRGF